VAGDILSFAVTKCHPVGQPPADSRLEPARRVSSDRRDHLLDAATELLADGDDAVSMDSVAERAGVSRPLVYKHFANRSELLAAVYERESNLLHRELAVAVNAADTLEAKFRALIRGALRAEASRGATFASLRSAGARGRALRERQHRRDRDTVQHFATLAVREYGSEERATRQAVSVLLGALTSVLAQWRRHPTPDNARVLEDVYVRLALGGLASLGEAQ
jgi:AcrR family transcriptional regulator